MDYIAPPMLPEEQQLYFCANVKDKRQITVDVKVARALDIRRGDILVMEVRKVPRK